MTSSEPNPDPREKLKAIREAFKESIQRAREGVRDTHKAFREAIRSDVLDEAKIREAARQWADRVAEEAILREKRSRELQAGMTAEQREQLERARAVVGERLKGMAAAVKTRLAEKQRDGTKR